MSKRVTAQEMNQMFGLVREAWLVMTIDGKVPQVHIYTDPTVPNMEHTVVSRTPVPYYVTVHEEYDTRPPQPMDVSTVWQEASHE